MASSYPPHLPCSFLGQHVVQQLLQQGHTVKCLVRRNSPGMPAGTQEAAQQDRIVVSEVYKYVLSWEHFVI